MTFVSESFHLSGHLTCGIRCWGSIYNFTYFATFRSLPNLRKYEMSISQNVHLPPPPCPTLQLWRKSCWILAQKVSSRLFTSLDCCWYTSLFKWPPLCRCQSRFYFARIHWGASARHPMRRVSNFWHGSVKLSLDSISLTISSRLEYLFYNWQTIKHRRHFQKEDWKILQGKVW